ncbi:MAG TPA: UDP-N-acetylmuramoyl-tripeptide--D-alanyl-D-alanine ligase [Gammaproteobacteria bacterium]|nr:UDP-N-acetylmuramoyl-tripeptide--D-alanyl-D-alanine ligase [Gammaproteobacteria bacterium]
MMRLSQVKKILNAELIGQDVSFDAVSTDSRTLPRDSLFVALTGENFDGHNFIEDALKKGAKAILVAQKEVVPQSASALLVADPIEALAKLARFHRAQFSIPCIGVTGSCGKTTVKSMIGAILSRVGKTLISQGNFNNHIGLPLTLFNLKKEHQFIVVEMGASAPLEIAYLGQVAQPTIALITNVHNAHLSGFGSLENVAKTKAEIYEALDTDGVAILNHDSPYAAFWQKIIGFRKTVTFGIHKPAAIKADKIHYNHFKTAFRVATPKEQFEVTLNLPGEHNVQNALAAIACIYHLNIPKALIQEALYAYQGVPGRLTPHELSNGIQLIDDTYNAIPDAVEAAIEVLAKSEHEKLLVMGDMAELGVHSEMFHERMGAKAKKVGIDHLWAVGPLSQSMVKAFGVQGRWFASKAELMAELKKIDKPMTILIKGSRSSGMEELVDGLLLSRKASYAASAR